MSVLTSRPVLRWLVPLAAAAAVIGGSAAIRLVAASAADPDLPPRSAAQLLVDLQTARLDGLSGTVVERADLGLPALPNLNTGGSSDLTSLISGTHTLRVWYAGPSSLRVALLGTLGESDVIANGSDVWVWSSRTNTAKHSKLPTGLPAMPLNPGNLPLTPQQAADAALAALDPTTVVTTAGSARVAGRAAYELVLAPRDAASLIGQVRIAIDADKHVPLRVQVFARNATDPAIEVAFTQISFTRPGAEQFQFNPPPGAKVTEAEAPASPPEKITGRPQTALVGKGWAAVFAVRVPVPADGLLRGLPSVSGTWGSGKLISGELFSVLLTDDGRVLAGAVAPERLYQAATDPAAAPK